MPREWSAIPGHHCDVEDETVKRLRVLCHVGLAFLFDRWLVKAGSRTGRGGSMMNG
jgi:hypothetical protein